MSLSLRNRGARPCRCSLRGPSARENESEIEDEGQRQDVDERNQENPRLRDRHIPVERLAGTTQRRHGNCEGNRKQGLPDGAVFLQKNRHEEFRRYRTRRCKKLERFLQSSLAVWRQLDRKSVV